MMTIEGSSVPNVSLMMGNNSTEAQVAAWIQGDGGYLIDWDYENDNNGINAAKRLRRVRRGGLIANG